MTRFSHEDNGQEMECEQCGLLAPLSFTPCCGMLVCDNCRQTHTSDDCKIIKEQKMTQNNHHPADKIYRQFADGKTLRYEGFQPRPQGGGFPLYTSLLTGSTIAVPVPCDKDGMPTVLVDEISELVELCNLNHQINFGLLPNVRRVNESI